MTHWKTNLESMVYEPYLLCYKCGSITIYEKWSDFCDDEAWGVAEMCCYNLHYSMNEAFDDNTAYYWAMKWKPQHRNLIGKHDNLSNS